MTRPWPGPSGIPGAAPAHVLLVGYVVLAVLVARAVLRERPAR